MESRAESEIRGHLNKPEFDGGTFTIDYLSTSPSGFEIKTEKSTRRRSLGSPLPLGPQEREQLKRAMGGQMKFAQGDIAKDALVRLRESTGDERDVAFKEYQKKREIYVERAKPVIRVRNVRKENNTLIIDIKPGDFPTYKEFAKSQSPAELLEFASVASTSMVLITADRKLIIQHRSPRNVLFGDMPGASVAGYLNGEFYHPSPGESPKQETGTLLPIDTNFVKQNIIREAEEEIGLKKEDLADLRIIGLAHERVQIHDEFLLFGETKLTAREMREKARNAIENKKLNEQEFYEKFVDIPATPEAIVILLTKVKCPLPPTHVAVFVAAGYSMILDTEGQEAANNWMAKIEEGVKRNYQEIDQMVAKYYQEYPEVLKQQLEGKPPRTPNGYEPAYFPQEQGLPDVVPELKRVGLISQTMDNITESSKNPEMEKQIDHAWLFDVDGVITNPEQKRVTEPRIIDEIVKRLESGEPVALVTGRSIDFMRERVLEPLKAKVSDLAILQNFLAMGEKGGVWITYDQEGNPQEHVDKNISVPKTLQDDVRTLIHDEFSDLMFYDKSKKTMISTEMIDGVRLEDYHARQKVLDQKLEELVREHGLQDRLEVDPTTIATDIQNKHVGKDFAARRVLAWLKERNIKPAQFITIGDSKSDVPIAQEIHDQGLPVTFIFVGKEADRADIERRNLPFPVTFTQNNYEKGTLEYLTSH